MTPVAIAAAFVFVAVVLGDWLYRRAEFRARLPRCTFCGCIAYDGEDVIVAYYNGRTYHYGCAPEQEQVGK